MRNALPVLLAFLLTVNSAHADSSDLFESKVRPILLKHCLKCHGPDKQKANLRLDSKSGWQTGGENGPVIIPGKPDESLLIRAVRHSGDLKMPEQKLAEYEIAALVEWVKLGANDPRDGGVRLGGMTLAEAKKWWSLQPLKTPPIPKNGSTSPVDAFLLEKLATKKLNFAPPTDKRTLIRRATYDLTGLPPTPAEVEAFLQDTSSEAFSKVVERLLASPRYGERWGRHWLDLVRYADTAGENSDHPLPHAWRYRNWVIEAFNADKPYDQFLHEQLAGDILAKTGPADQYAARITATGFLATARRFGHEIDKDIHLTYEDVIDTVGKAFLGLSIGCARCHDHKYDPISAKDYYALYGIFASTKFAFPGCEPQQQPRDLVPLVSPDVWVRTIKPQQDKLDDAERNLQGFHQRQVRSLQQFKLNAAKATKLLAKGEIADGGEAVFKDLPEKVQVRDGEMLQLSITPLKNHGADTTLVEWEIVEVGGKKRRWNITSDVVDNLLSANPHGDAYQNKNVWCFLDGRTWPTLLPEKLANLNGKPGLNVWRSGDTPSVLVNATKESINVWTKLEARSLFVHPAPDGNVVLGWLSSFTGSVRITGRIKDAHPGGPDGVGWVMEHIASDLTAASIQTQQANQNRKQDFEKRRDELLAQLPKPVLAYAVQEGDVKDVRMHLRGDPEKLGVEVPRRWLEVFGGQPLPKDAGSGRLQLAQWIASKDNPLTARVMVNRIWQHHFGKGLVQTSNDFGSRGLAPTHPELLDFLASEFIASSWSVKAMHRRMMLSQAYQQSSAVRSDTALDANNDLYAKFNVRRLSADELRDSLLATSGKLDLVPGEAHPFPPEKTWNYTQHVPFSTFFETDKRSVYLVSLRNRRHPFLGLFDGADPNATTPQRQVTTVPTQALYFMNDPFFHAQADKLAERVLTKKDGERLRELFTLALQRTPTERDRINADKFLSGYAATLLDMDTAKRTKASWAALARIVLASNEFLFLD